MKTKLTSFSRRRNFCDFSIVFTSALLMISYCHPRACSLHPRFELCNMRGRVDMNTFIMRLTVIIFTFILVRFQYSSPEHFVLEHNLFSSELWSGSGYLSLFIIIYNGCWHTRGKRRWMMGQIVESHYHHLSSSEGTVSHTVIWGSL